jgi:hypothetical protein
MKEIIEAVSVAILVTLALIIRFKTPDNER